MVAAISGSGLGVFNSSASGLGNEGVNGNARTGPLGEQVLVNTHTGNVVIQQQDELTVAKGLDVAVLRTYNSQGVVDGDNDDNWRIGLFRQLKNLTGTVNTSGSTITKVYGDGAEVTFTYDSGSGRYIGNEVDGARDTLQYDSGTSTWTWMDGSSRNTETYDATYRLTTAADTSGNLQTYAYNANGTLASVTDASVINGSRQVTHLDYTGTNLSQIRVVSDGLTQTRTRYAYDASNRLITVTVDLSPADNAVTDLRTVVTTYTYEGASKRIASFSVWSGTDGAPPTSQAISFTYEQVGSSSVYRVKTITDGNGNLTTYTYSTQADGTLKTDVQDALGQVTTFIADTAGRLLFIDQPTVGGTRIEKKFTYTNGYLSAINIDESGINYWKAYNYNANGLLIMTTDSTSNDATLVGQRLLTNYSYDSANQLTLATEYTLGDNVTQAGTHYIYDSQSRLRFEMTNEGLVTEYQYNAAGQRVSQLKYAGAAMGVAGWEWWGGPTEANIMDWWANWQDKTAFERTDYEYDFRGNLSKAKAYGSTDWTGAGIATTASITQYVYDQHGQLLQIIDPRGAAEGTVADGVTDSKSYSTTYTYDGAGRQLTKRWCYSPTYLDGGNTVYTIANNRLKVETALFTGLYHELNYDGVGNLISDHEYDPFYQSNPAALGQASYTDSGTTTYSYDAANRLRMVTAANGLKQYYLYDAASRQIADIDSNGTLTEFVYNSANQVVKTTRYADALSSTQLASLIDVNGKPTAVTLATLKDDLVTTEGRDKDQITRTVYDSAGKVAYTINAVGAVTENYYDYKGRLTDQVTYAATVSIDSSAGELRAVVADLTTTTPNLTRTFKDTSGATVGSLTVNSAVDRHNRNFHNKDGRLLGTLDAEGYLTENAYNAAGHLSQQTRYATQTAAANRLAGTLSTLRPATTLQDIVSYYFYDRQGRQIASLQNAYLDGSNAMRWYLSETKYYANGLVQQVIRHEHPITYTVGTALSSLVTAATGSKDQTTTYDYFGDGRLKSETNYQGSITNFTYGSNLDTVTVAAGDTDERVTQVKHDANGRVIGELSAQGSADIAAGMDVATAWDRYGTSYVYNLVGWRISASSKSYDAAGTLLTTNTSYFYYNEDGQLRFTVNALGERTENRYNALGQLTNTLNYSNRIATTGLTGGLVTSSLLTTLTANPDANKDAELTYTYKLTGQLESSASAIAIGARTDYTYNTFGEVASTSEKLDATRTIQHSYTYNQRGLLTQTQWDPSGINRFETYGYDAFGRRTQVTDQYGNLTKTDYDRLGRVVATYDALNAKQSISYDAFSRMLTTTDANLNTTFYLYTDSTRTVQVTSPKGIVSSVQNRLGQTVTVTNEGGSITKTGYNKDGQVTDVTIAFNSTTDASTTLYAYDSTGRTLTVTEGSNSIATVVNGVTVGGPRVTQYVYDAAGRRIEEIVKKAQVANSSGLVADTDLHTYYRYDGKGNLTRKIDAAGNSTWYVYDKDNRLTQTIDALGGVTEMTYDVDGHVIATRRYATPTTIPTTDVAIAAVFSTAANDRVNDRVEQYAYDTLGRQIYQVDALGGVTQLDYDANGNVIRKVAYAKVINAASTTAYTQPSVISAALVTALNTPGSRSDKDRVQWTAYDANNRASLSVDAAGAITQYRYDSNGNLIQSTAYSTPINIASLNNAVRLTNDGTTGIRVWTTALASSVVTLTTNAADRTTRYWYDAVNRVRFTLDAEWFLKETQYLDNFRQQINKVYFHPATIPDGTQLQDVPAIAAGLPSSSRTQTTTTQYDYAGRIYSVTDTDNKTEYYGYDAVGNKIWFTNKKGTGPKDPAYTWNYEYDANHRLITEYSPAVAVTTMQAFNTGTSSALRSETSNVSIVTRMKYDQLGNVTARIEDARVGGQNRTTTYQYDVLGRQTRVNYPEVAVYDAANDNIDRTGTDVVRQETLLTSLYSEVSYDTLGNAFRNRDIAGNFSFKVYDNLGRVTFDVDAKNYATALLSKLG